MKSEEVKCPVAECLDKMEAGVTGRHKVQRLHGYIVANVCRRVVQERVEDEVREAVCRMRSDELLKLAELAESREVKIAIAEKEKAEKEYRATHAMMAEVPSQAGTLAGFTTVGDAQAPQT